MLERSDAARLPWFRRQNRLAMAGVATETVRWGDVGIYVLVAFGLSWTVWLGLRPVIPELVIRTFIAMFGPMFAAVAVIRIRRGDRLRHQWRVSLVRLVDNVFASGLAVSITSLTIAAGVGLSLVSGDLKPLETPSQNLLLILPLPVAFFAYWISAFGEEYGWRGFLQPTLAPLGGARSSIVIAVVFAAWHAPAILFDGFDYPRHHIIGIFDLLVFAVPFTVVQAWLRSATGGIAAPVAAHATVNVFAGQIYSHTIRTTSIIAAPVGLLGSVAFAVVALALLVTGRLWSRDRREPGHQGHQSSTYARPR